MIHEPTPATKPSRNGVGLAADDARRERPPNAPGRPPAGSLAAGPVEEWGHDELMGTEFGDLRWLAHGLVPDESVTILGGIQKAGKSWLSIQLALAVASGEDFLGRATSPGPVIYLALEDGAKRLKDRLEKQGSPLGLPVTWITRFPKLDNVEGVAQFQQLAARRPKLLILDTLAAAKSGRTDEQAAGAMADLFNLIREIAQRERLAILIVHHHGKSVSGDPAHDLRGSSAIGAAADVLLGLYRVRRTADGGMAEADGGMADPEGESAPDFYLKSRGRDIEDGTLAVAFGVNTDWRWRPADYGTHDRRRTKRIEKADEALAAVRAAGANGLTVAQLAERVGVPDTTARRILTELAALHQIRTESRPNPNPAGGRPLTVFLSMD